MKKRVLTLLLALAMIVSLAACGGGGSSAAGTYKLTEMNAGGISMDLEELASTAGVDMSILLELKMDGTFSLDMGGQDMSGLTDGVSLAGTWKASGSDLIFTMDGEDLTVPFDGKTIVMEQDGTSLTFVKQ